MTNSAEDLAQRERRVAEAVWRRIAAAPPRRPPVEPWFDLQPWSRHALAAAAIVIVLSGWSLARSPAMPQTTTVAGALGLPAPVTQWLEHGDVSAWDMLSSYGGRR